MTDVFLDDMFSDPLVLLVMQANGVSEAQLRRLYSRLQSSRTWDDGSN